MKQSNLRALALCLLWPLAAAAQGDTQPSVNAAATPATAVQTAPLADALPAASPTVTPAPVPSATPVATPSATPTPPLLPASAEAPAEAKPGPGEIRLNFKNASLADVLAYLSDSLGFIVVQDAPVAGTVNVVSKQPINAEDAIDLLNSVLAEKGYIAVRNGRILKIINRRDAQKADIPVMSGSDPTQIPRKDGMVTQILPVRYVDATKLVDNLRPLLSADATLSANEASNAILLADTQTNVHRIAEIIHALDTSVAGISAIRVFQLQYADPKSLASILTQLFAADQSAGRGNNTGGRGGAANLPPWAAALLGGRGGPGGMGGGDNPSAAQQAASRVVAVADSQSNSVIVSAPEAAMTTIADIVKRIDTNISDITENRIFWLQHSDATELSNIINSLFADTGTAPAGGNRNGQQKQPAPPPAANRSDRSLLQTRVVAVPDVRTNALIISAARDSMTQIADIITHIDTDVSAITETRIFRIQHGDATELSNIVNSLYADPGTILGASNGSQQKPKTSTQNTGSDWAVLQTRVVTVPDPRTNSLIVTASQELMPQIATTIERLDSSDAKKQKVYIYNLENADPDNVATILRGMFSKQSTSSSTGAQPTSNALNRRTVNGASSDISNILNTSSNSSRSR